MGEYLMEEIQGKKGGEYGGIGIEVSRGGCEW